MDSPAPFSPTRLVARHDRVQRPTGPGVQLPASVRLCRARSCGPRGTADRVTVDFLAIDNQYDGEAVAAEQAQDLGSRPGRTRRTLNVGLSERLMGCQRARCCLWWRQVGRTARRPGCRRCRRRSRIPPPPGHLLRCAAFGLISRGPIRQRHRADPAAEPARERSGVRTVALMIHCSGGRRGGNDWLIGGVG